jgi:hypothetical protein
MPRVEKVKATCTALGSHYFSMRTIVCGDNRRAAVCGLPTRPASKIRRLADAVPLIAKCDTSYREI